MARLPCGETHSFFGDDGDRVTGCCAPSHSTSPRPTSTTALCAQSHCYTSTCAAAAYPPHRWIFGCTMVMRRMSSSLADRRAATDRWLTSGGPSVTSVRNVLRFAGEEGERRRGGRWQRRWVDGRMDTAPGFVGDWPGPCGRPALRMFWDRTGGDCTFKYRGFRQGQLGGLPARSPLAAPEESGRGRPERRASTGGGSTTGRSRDGARRALRSPK